MVCPIVYQRAPSISAKRALLSEHQSKLLLAPPQKGSGHRELFRDACILRRHGFTTAEQEQVLRERFANYYRDISDRELADAINNAAGAREKHWPRWPRPQASLIARILSAPGSLDQVREASPVKVPGSLKTGDVLDRFIQKEDILCMGKSAAHSETEVRSWFRGREHEYQLVVPNAMRATTGTTKDGRPSRRCLGNSGQWRTQVIEFDSGTISEQARLHCALSSIGGALRMLVLSGGKSLHGWYDVRDWQPRELEAFRWHAAALGADTATFTACQFVRTPNAVRDNNNLQEVVFLK